MNIYKSLSASLVALNKKPKATSSIELSTTSKLIENAFKAAFRILQESDPKRYRYSQAYGLESIYWVGIHGNEGIHFHKSTSRLQHIYVSDSGIPTQDALQPSSMATAGNIIKFIEMN